LKNSIEFCANFLYNDILFIKNTMRYEEEEAVVCIYIQAWLETSHKEACHRGKTY